MKDYKKHLIKYEILLREKYFIKLYYHSIFFFSGIHRSFLSRRCRHRRRRSWTRPRSCCSPRTSPSTPSHPPGCPRSSLLPSSANRCRSSSSSHCRCPCPSPCCCRRPRTILRPSPRLRPARAHFSSRLRVLLWCRG